ncbi:MAG: extracellular solute-binding protein [Acetobacteraceae bacterium]
MADQDTQGLLEEFRGHQGRRALLQALVAIGAGGGALLRVADALADVPADQVAQLTLLIQGGPVGDVLRQVANPLFARSYPKATVEFDVSSNTVAYPKMLAQRENPVIGGGMFNDLYSARGTLDKMWVPFNPAFLPNGSKVPAPLLVPGSLGITLHQTPFGIMYNPDRVEAPTSWTDLWKPAYRGRVSMWETYFDAYAMAAQATGKAPDVAEGIKAWAPHKQNIGAWVTSPVAEEDLVHRGEMWLAPHWGAWAEQAKAQGKRVAFAMPKEGATLWSNQAQCCAGFSPEMTELLQRCLNTWFSDECQTAWLTKTFISPAVSSVAVPAEMKSNPAIVSAADAGKLVRLDAQLLAKNFAAYKMAIDRTLKS